MKIQSITNNQTNFTAVNKHYYDWAVKESKATKGYGELFYQLRCDVCWGDIHPQDAIDTIEAMKTFMTTHKNAIEYTLDYVKGFLKK